MTTLVQLGKKLVPIVDAAMTAHKKERQLMPLPYTVHSAQMSIYWFREAVRLLDKIPTTNAITEEDITVIKDDSPPSAPTLFSTQDYLTFINTKLAELIKETEDFMESTSLPTQPLYFVQQGYNKIHESLFNAELANTYYEQLNRGN